MAGVLILLNEKAGSAMLKKINLMLFAGVDAINYGEFKKRSRKRSTNNIKFF